jgi:hypothetical protein
MNKRVGFFDRTMQTTPTAVIQNIPRRWPLFNFGQKRLNYLLKRETVLGRNLPDIEPPLAESLFVQFTSRMGIGQTTELVAYHSQRPNITLLILLLPEILLRTQIVRSARNIQPLLPLRNYLRDIKIPYLETLLSHKNIRRFYVAMPNRRTVQVIQPVRHIRKHFPHERLFKPHVSLLMLLKHTLQISFLGILKHNINDLLLWIVEALVDASNVGVLRSK